MSPVQTTQGKLLSEPYTASQTAWAETAIFRFFEHPSGSVSSRRPAPTIRSALRNASNASSVRQDWLPGPIPTTVSFLIPQRLLFAYRLSSTRFQASSTEYPSSCVGLPITTKRSLLQARSLLFFQKAALFCRHPLSRGCRYGTAPSAQYLTQL